jgi:hypothetical protein
MTNNKQQTAVEWLSQKVLHREWELLTQEKKRKILEQAKEMEKEQAIKLHYEYELYVMMNESVVMTFGQFYEQTYGGNK